MTKREERKTVQANHKKLYKTWAEEKARGMSLSAFCKIYGLSRKNFYLWLKDGNNIVMALRGMLSVGTIRKIIAPHKIRPHCP